MEIILKSIITCPNCEYNKEKEMPTNACQYFYECENCKTLRKPLEGDCSINFVVTYNPSPPPYTDRQYNRNKNPNFTPLTNTIPKWH